ncbi:hypothetical protein LOTGIDRAFT_154100 [Lottia gigantea]|uniref:AP-1 complex-associated regulatory protein n=1 Tax=Lottia gigantea TaxID=225164 RepID=V4A268_LOTGI|nr:hypothetical protein LOTGIDRAFT_154100 [Lottia gigantea]ESO89025.1 hypothetical protein LOTGIDRAFT_154100 [Lottia gigantea]
MGNCLAKCCGRFDKRRQYLRTRYDVERDYSIEFENLMDEDNNQYEANRCQLQLTSGPFTVSTYVRLLYLCFVYLSRPLTDHEKAILSKRQYTVLLHEQKKIDQEIDAKLAQHEEEIKQEEEALIEAKREAARTAKLQRAKEQAAKKNATTHGSKSWLDGNEDEWEIAGGDDDFEIFLASVKARSLAARTQAQLRQGSGDGQSSSSSLTKDRTDVSSLDLEWDHEAGVVPQAKPQSSTDDSLEAFMNGSQKDSPINSNDLEWDNDFVSAEDIETEQLISKTTDKKFPILNR